MLRRTLLTLFVLALASAPTLVPTTSAQETPRYSRGFSCTSVGTATMDIWSRSDYNLEMTGFALTANGPLEVGQLIVGPWEQSEQLFLSPDSPPVNGWRFEVVDLGTGELLEAPGYTNEVCGYTEYPDETPVPTTAPITNGFSFLTVERMCTDQSFHATWSGTNVTNLEFSLTNTSDNWVSGWIAVDPASGMITHAVDHHSYDKVAAQVTFADGTDQLVDADVGTCTEVPAPPPAPSGSTSVPVTSLPSTGTGSDPETLVILTGLSLIASVLIVAGSLRQRQ